MANWSFYVVPGHLFT